MTFSVGNEVTRTVRGFTLLELLIVIVIAAVLAGLVVPRFAQALPALQLRQSTQEVAALLRMSRNRAISESRVVDVLIDVQQGLVSPGYGDEHYDLPDGISATFPDSQFGGASSQHRFRFAADGTSSGGQLVLSTDKRAYVVAVDWLTGRVSIL